MICTLPLFIKAVTHQHITYCHRASEQKKISEEIASTKTTSNLKAP